MTVDQLLRCLADCAVELFLDGDRLRYRAPAGALTPDLRGEISARRSAIIDHLRAAAATDAVGTRCTICDRPIGWTPCPRTAASVRHAGSVGVLLAIGLWNPRGLEVFAKTGKLLLGPTRVVWLRSGEQRNGESVQEARDDHRPKDA